MKKVLIASLLASSAFALGIEGSFGVWKQDPGGYISYQGDRLDVDTDLRYDKRNRLMGRLKLQTPSIIPDNSLVEKDQLPNIYLMATQSSFSGEGSKTVNFTFGGQSFQANIPFYSEVKLHHYDIGLYYDLPFLSKATEGVLNVELGINARILDLKERVRQGNIDESKSLTAVVPMIYTGVGIKPIRFASLESELRGIAYNNNHYYDIIGRIKVKPINQVFIAGGYREQGVKVNVSDVKSKLKLKGFFAEAGFEF